MSPVPGFRRVGGGEGELFSGMGKYVGGSTDRLNIAILPLTLLPQCFGRPDLIISITEGRQVILRKHLRY